MCLLPSKRGVKLATPFLDKCEKRHRNAKERDVLPSLFSDYLYKGEEAYSNKKTYIIR